MQLIHQFGVLDIVFSLSWSLPNYVLSFIDLCVWPCYNLSVGYLSIAGYISLHSFMSAMKVGDQNAPLI
ncbi:hypothetical protein Peur_064650 [Populus x canadensis]|jgi:hypothetical protein